MRCIAPCACPGVGMCLYFATNKRGKNANGGNGGTHNKRDVETVGKGLLQLAHLRGRQTTTVRGKCATGGSTAETGKDGTGQRYAQALTYDATSGQEAAFESTVGKKPGEAQGTVTPGDPTGVLKQP